MIKDEWEIERVKLSEKLAKWCGEFPKRPDLDIRETYKRDYSTHTEIKLSYQGETGERIPAYLLIPRAVDTSERHPAIFAAHQCAWQCDVGKEQVVGKRPDLSDQAYGFELVRRGYIVLAPDANKIGERFDTTLRKQWQTAADLKGQHACCIAPGGPWGPIRWKPVFDVMRGIDFLCQHPLVDNTNIGMIGHSLGADTTIWTMPFDNRIKAAAISGGGLITDGSWFPYGLHYHEILSLIAPRPFLEISGTLDDVNWKLLKAEKEVANSQLDGMQWKRESHSIARKIYRLYNAQDNVTLFEFEGKHEFIKHGREAAYSWFDRFLKG